MSKKGINKLFTQDEFEVGIGVNRYWQWRARRAGFLGYYRFNHQIRYSQKHIEEFLKRHEVKAMPFENKGIDETECELSGILITKMGGKKE